MASIWIFIFEQAGERMKTAPTRDALMMIIAQTVLALDDSHTTFYPPSRAAEIDYGWQVGMVGDNCYVTRIKPKSDAEAKGVKPGDRLISIDGFRPTRKNLWQMYYRYKAVAPTAKVAMTLLSPGEEKPRVVDVQTKISKSSGLLSIQQWYDKVVIRGGALDSEKTHESVSFGNELLIWKMKSFVTDEINIDKMMAKARNHKSLILDLRGNGGGYVDIEKRLLGYFFDKDVKIGDEKTRKETKARFAKTRGKDLFSGNLIVLVDQESASASEVFAKIIQLEKRGKVIGDKTSGSVMTSRFHPLSTNIGSQLWFGASITMADLIMTDGKSLEKIGVTPDEVMLPTGTDLAGSKDPVLSYAAKLSGVELTPEKAGTFFPYEWPRN